VPYRSGRGTRQHNGGKHPRPRPGVP
jgi:hypothetical protein